MITPTQMYWLTRLDNINYMTSILLLLVSLACIVMTVVGAALRASEKGYEWQDSGVIAKSHATGKKLHKAAIGLIVLWVMLLVGLTLTPTTKEMAAILIVPRIANSEKIQTVGNSIYDLALAWMEELKPTKAKGKN